MRNSSINQINHFELSFGGGPFSAEGGFAKNSPKDFFRQLQTRVSLTKF